MALVIMCGQPCSGKSSAAEWLVKNLTTAMASQTGAASSFRIKLIDEPSLNLDRNQSYISMPVEKNLRGVLRSEVDRSISKESIIILDSLNNIKGYRYELWCLARAAGIKYCVLHCDVGENDCKSWNSARQARGEASYDESILDDLLRRFERPDNRNRWDSPLFELRPKEEGIMESNAAIAEAVSFIIGVNSRGRNSAVLLPTIATKLAKSAETNSLYELDQATQEVIGAIVAAQAHGGGGNSGIIVTIGDGLPSVKLGRSVGLPELRRLKRTFVKLAGQTSLSGPPPPSDSFASKRMFAEYLNRELSSAS